MSPSNPFNRKTFVLVHGAWHGAWCWHKLVPLLAAQGHRAIAPDLPAMGSDTTDPATITLAGWARFVADLIARQPQQVVLVGHSRAGIVISETAELAPTLISRLVYLCAFLLPAGHNLAAAARADVDSLVAPNMVPAAGGVTCTVRDNALHDAFFGRCSDEDFAHARERVSPEPLKPLVTPLTITPERFGSVPRAYIECTQDRAVSLAAQRRMLAVLPCDPVFTLDSDHSPFLSQPQELALLLGRL